MLQSIDERLYDSQRVYRSSLIFTTVAGSLFLEDTVYVQPPTTLGSFNNDIVQPLCHRLASQEFKCLIFSPCNVDFICVSALYSLLFELYARMPFATKEFRQE